MYMSEYLLKFNCELQEFIYIGVMWKKRFWTKTVDSFRYCCFF